MSTLMSDRLMNADRLHSSKPGSALKHVTNHHSRFPTMGEAVGQFNPKVWFPSNKRFLHLALLSLLTHLLQLGFSCSFFLLFAKKVDPHLHYEFGGPIGTFSMMVFFPAMMYYFFICVSLLLLSFSLPLSTSPLPLAVWRISDRHLYQRKVYGAMMVNYRCLNRWRLRMWCIGVQSSGV